ncbi:MAG TPA: biopolymer transporter ExbD [Burkholderiales bacterium]|nr:biopolymer transporter ExbD [Burkholderiales bacterium]
MRRTGSTYFEVARPRVEVIPMIDIMMFLLVFFVIIALQMIAGTGVPIELPGSATTRQLVPSTITIGVTKSGELVLDGKPVTPDELKSRLAALAKQNKLDVVLAADKDASLQTLLTAMDSVRGAGITSVGIAARAQKR